jgi:alpha/beta superfamily hydrolase
MDSPVVNEIAYAAREAGLASLRFNWRGVGASAGTVSGERSDAESDYRAALTHLLETVPGVVFAAGYSFGAAAAASVAVGESRVRRLLLVAPPPVLLDPTALAEFAGRLQLVVGSNDAIAAASELEEVAASLPRAIFTAIPDADHFFSQGLAAVGRSARAAFATTG